MICIGETPIGYISYGQICFGERGLKPGVMELDIWMDGENRCGKGFGTDTIICLTDFLHCKYDINTFFMVPRKKNLRAVKSYEKSGFIKTLADEKQKVLERIFTTEYLKSLNEDDVYLSEGNWFMVKNYV
jgi:diamine N-acetyltransferase